MKSKFLLSSILFLSIAAGCEKSPDFGRIQEETLTLVRLHATEVETLQRRADALLARGQALGGNAPGISEAGPVLSAARSQLDQLRMEVSTAPTTMANAAKSGELDEVERTSDELLEKIESGTVAVRANLATVDNWLMSVEDRDAAAATPPAPPPAPPAPTETEVPPPPPGATDAGSGAGSAAAAGSGSAAGSAAK